MTGRWSALAGSVTLVFLTGCGPAVDPLPALPRSPVTSTPVAATPSILRTPAASCGPQAAIDVGAPLVPAASPQDDGETDIAANDLQDPDTDAGRQEAC